MFQSSPNSSVLFVLNGGTLMGVTGVGVTRVWLSAQRNTVDQTVRFSVSFILCFFWVLFLLFSVSYLDLSQEHLRINEPRHAKTCFFNMQK